MYKNIKVMRFNVETHETGLLNKDYIPLCIRRQNEDYSFDSVRQFCSLRVFLMNRAYCKELLTSCGVEFMTMTPDLKEKAQKDPIFLQD